MSRSLPTLSSLLRLRRKFPLVLHYLHSEPATYPRRSPAQRLSSLSTQPAEPQQNAPNQLLCFSESDLHTTIYRFPLLRARPRPPLCFSDSPACCCVSHRFPASHTQPESAVYGRIQVGRSNPHLGCNLYTHVHTPSPAGASPLTRQAPAQRSGNVPSPISRIKRFPHTHISRLFPFPQSRFPGFLLRFPAISAPISAISGLAGKAIG